MFRTVLIVTLAFGPVTALAQTRDPRPVDRERAAAAAADGREAALRDRVASAPEDLPARFELAKLQEDTGRHAAAEETLLQARSVAPANLGVLSAIASFYNRRGQFERTVEVLEEAARLDPANPRGFHLIGTFYQAKIAKDSTLTPEQKHEYIRAGIEAEDQALALNPDFVEALVYKNILLRQQANLETVPSERARLIAEADSLRTKAMALQKMATGQAGGMAGSVTSSGAAPPPPPPPPPPAGTQSAGTQMADGAVRVGGTIGPPTKVRHVNPTYPPEALSAKMQGVVIIEARIERDGTVGGARVLRSIPMLDEAALDAVRQWEFTPTLLNGEPVPVIMTVTVNFTMQ